MRQARLHTHLFTRLTGVSFLLCCLLAPAFINGQEASSPIVLDSMLEPFVGTDGLPSLSVAVIKNERLLAVGTAGLRRRGSPEAATGADAYHIGSIGKSMTATLAALMVEKGLIRWDLTLEEAFQKELVVAESLRKVTLAQLLQNRGGIGVEADYPGIDLRLVKSLGVEKARASAARVIVQKGALHKPGSYSYSNPGYGLAGHLLERASGKSWEDLVQALLFKPLKLETAGFGPSASTAKVDQPWGHSPEGQPVSPDEPNEALRLLAAAGDIHMSAPDLARYAAFHVRGELEGDPLLSVESFRFLHSPAAPSDDKDTETYGCGWMVDAEGLGGGPIYGHTGSNKSFYAVASFCPAWDTSVVVLCNSAEAPVDSLALEIAKQLMLQFGPAEALPLEVGENGTSAPINFSTRGWVAEGDGCLIAGLVLGGSEKRSLLLRGAGPSLAKQGVKSALSDTDLELIDSTGRVLARNSGWDSEVLESTCQQLGAFSFEKGSRDSGLVVDLEPGLYTIILRPGRGAPGVGLIEVYATPSEGMDSSMLNLSGRGYLRTGEGNNVINGFVLSGGESRQVMLRAAGPALRDLGVNTPAEDPVLRIYDAQGQLLFENDDWYNAGQLPLLQTTEQSTGAFPLRRGSRDAAILVSLAPGVYTAIVQDRNGGEGIALVETYVVPTH